MGKSRHPKTVTGEVAKNPTKAALNESNEMSYLSGGRNVEHDYYQLENRERQLKMVDSLTDEERQYIAGKDASGTNKASSAADIKKAVQRIHEQDLLELKALVYLQSLPDTSPEYSALKTMTGGNSRETIARMLAEKQMKKLYLSQVEKILDTASLGVVYKAQMTKGADAFKGLWGST